MKTLKDVKVGRTAKDVKLHGEGPVKRRIMDMGITKGVIIYVIKMAPLGDPVAISVRGYTLSLRKSDLAMLEGEIITTSNKNQDMQKTGSPQPAGSRLFSLRPEVHQIQSDPGIGLPVDLAGDGLDDDLRSGADHGPVQMSAVAPGSTGIFIQLATNLRSTALTMPAALAHLWR